jgi:hypothetical protein
MLIFCSVVRATSVIAPDFDELVGEANYVVRAVVKSAVGEKRVMPDGAKVIFTRVELDVREVVAGTPPSPLVLEVMGGRVGDREMMISGAPRFNVGEESILFVQGNGQQIFPLVRMMHGFYRIQKDADGRAIVVRSNGAPLYQVSDVSRSPDDRSRSASGAKALSAEDFVAQIRTRSAQIHSRAK